MSLPQIVWFFESFGSYWNSKIARRRHGNRLIHCSGVTRLRVDTACNDRGDRGRCRDCAYRFSAELARFPGVTLYSNPQSAFGQIFHERETIPHVWN